MSVAAVTLDGFARSAQLGAVAPVVPLLHIWGEKDEAIGGAAAKALQASKPAAEVQSFMMKGASHPCYLDSPKRFNARLLKFLGRAEGLGRRNANVARRTQRKDNKRSGGMARQKRP